MEGVSTAWSIEIQDSPEPLHKPGDDRPQSELPAEADDGSSAVSVFEQTIKDPKRDTTMGPPGSQQNGDKIEVEANDMQSFLTKQLEVLEQLKAEDEKDRATKQAPELEMTPLDDNGQVNEHIGPVQFNMGGIQVDADDMLRKLKVHPRSITAPQSSHYLTKEQEREASRSQRKEGLPTSPGGEKAHNQALANFFAGLVKKPGGSPGSSPNPGSSRGNSS